MKLQDLGALTGAEDIPNSDRPDFSADSGERDVFDIKSAVEKERKPRTKEVDVHATASKIIYIRESVRKSVSGLLNWCGAGFADVVMINSFHVFQGPNFAGTRDEQFAAFNAVKDEFMPRPYPAWTAVGTTGLLADNVIVEIQLIAHIPSK